MKAEYLLAAAAIGVAVVVVMNRQAHAAAPATAPTAPAAPARPTPPANKQDAFGPLWDALVGRGVELINNYGRQTATA